jgi:hypothetical protein
VALHHFYRNTRRVRLGGWRLGPLAGGGAWYSVEPMTMLRIVQFVQACGRLGETPSLDGLVSRMPLEVLRPLVPFWIAEPVNPRHLRRASRAQIEAAFAAAGEVQDLPYMLDALMPKEGGEKSGQGIEVLAVSVARELHLGDPETVLRWPFQKVLATLDALRSQSEDGLPPGAEPLSDSERGGLTGLLQGLGMVN